MFHFIESSEDLSTALFVLKTNFDWFKDELFDTSVPNVKSIKF